ncbi:hypothetical protein IV203_015842 [Nitzschia inconspicua]|uniref:Uncharacterized protein n=1 Tax=Nitzschia inconspicua TaxID=303405 RepID=A0A9K3LCZ1_9STRA|nr:hypothetical protein IV203_015842 [Nitzschia inconspicua]
MEMHQDPSDWSQPESNATRLSLIQSSNLFMELCSPTSLGDCEFKLAFVLENDVPCFGIECEMSNVRAVQINVIFIEYIRQACVKLACFNDAKTLVKQTEGTQMCAAEVPHHGVNNNGGFPGELSDCESIPTFAPAGDGSCICDVLVSEDQDFFGSTLPSKSEIRDRLHIGAMEPLGEPMIEGDISVYQTNSDGSFSMSIIFAFVDDFGVPRLLKNIRSTVTVEGTGFKFRNPPHFNSLSVGEVRDSHHETEAVLDHYFYHPNTAPFLAFSGKKYVQWRSRVARNRHRQRSGLLYAEPVEDEDPLVLKRRDLSLRGVSFTGTAWFRNSQAS